MANWRDLCTTELKNAINNIVNTSSSQEEVNQRMKDEYDYPYTIAVSYSKSYRGMRMSMFMANDRHGNIIS